MKKLILLSALAIATISVSAQSNAKSQTVATSSQEDKAAIDKANKQTAKLDEIVGLTAAQKEKVYAIAIQKDQEIRAAAANKATFPTEKARIKQEREDALMAILTLDQQTKFKKAISDEKRKAASAK
jgi:protein CpxP